VFLNNFWYYKGKERAVALSFYYIKLKKLIRNPFFETKLSNLHAITYMRSLLCFTILTASSLAFEKPEDPSLHSSSSLPEIDYSKVKPIEQSKAVKSAEISTQSHAELKHEMSSNMQKPKVGGQSNLPWLGVLGDPLDAPLKAQLGLEHGLVLKYVVPDSPAAKAGLEVYDIIQSVNGEPVCNQRELKEAIMSLTVDDCIKLDVRSKGIKELVKVTLCNKPLMQ